MIYIVYYVDGCDCSGSVLYSDDCDSGMTFATRDKKVAEQVCYWMQWYNERSRRCYQVDEADFAGE